MSQRANNTHCSQCGVALHCAIQAGEKTCWCFALPNTLAVPKAEEKQGCLCHQCLQAAIEKAQKNLHLT